MVVYRISYFSPSSRPIDKIIKYGFKPTIDCRIKECEENVENEKQTQIIIIS